ncbi:unnamed protein product [Linum tenue]|uniref:non-specific serine/threonine protein kinase n=1 Tax=Linum tenue TaxID=586396 RepID=A0AAV0QJF8_9ROSI|nr:unnamed protein product [Linum tenue]
MNPLKMDRLSSTSEIVESTPELSLEVKMGENGGNSSIPTSNKYSIEDDINRLFEAIDIRRTKGSSHEGGSGRDALLKKAMKRPMRVGSPQASGIGISESVSLKQALRGLCISQASEMAAMKRLSRPTGSARASEAGSSKMLYRTVVVEANHSSGLTPSKGDGKVVEVSLVPETDTSSCSQNIVELSQIDKAGSSDQSADSSKCEIAPTGFVSEVSKLEIESPSALDSSSCNEQAQNVDDTIVSDSIQSSGEQSNAFPSPSGSSNGIMGISPVCNTTRFIKPIFRNRSFMKKKGKKDSEFASSSSNARDIKVRDDVDPSIGSATEYGDRASPASSGSTSNSIESSFSTVDKSSSKMGCNSSGCGDRSISKLTKIDERSISREKGESFSQNSKSSSIGEYSSSSTSMSVDSSLSGSSYHSGYRPHMSKDLRWEAIRQIQRQDGVLALRHFKLIKKLGGGDIGSVYLAELSGTDSRFALKVMDNEFLAGKKKMLRAQTEREILQMLDHPFLPTLYAHFLSEKLSCLVMEYCPGGDLHVLRQKQPDRCFSEHATRFFVAEVLLALEYLHMLGVVYRDLKPENVLVREDGHIMLSDFDLSLRCAVNPVLLQSTSPDIDPPKKTSTSPSCSESSCIDPFCLRPSWQVSCFTPRLLSVAATRSRKSLKSDLSSHQVTPLPQLVVEPTSARSNSFVGTHEYLAPEIIKSEGHGSAVDWWTFGIFLFELLYGRTPFKGSGNEETLSNVVSRSLKFPRGPVVGFHARDLIRGLLVKDPENRLGSARGAAEIKQHPFFEGLNWALIRCAIPPELQGYSDGRTSSSKCKGAEENGEFDMF